MHSAGSLWLALLLLALLAVAGCGSNRDPSSDTSEEAISSDNSTSRQVASDQEASDQEASKQDATQISKQDGKQKAPADGTSSNQPFSSDEKTDEEVSGALSSGEDFQQEWTHFRANAAATGFVDEELPAKLELAWSHRLDKHGFIGAPVVKAGVVYSVDMNGKTYAWDLKDGSQRWMLELGEFVDASPMLIADALFVGDLNGTLHCVDITKGELKWKKDLETSFITSCNEFNGDIITIGETGDLFRIKAETGEVVWKFATEDRILSSPAIEQGHCFLTGCNSKLYVISLDDPKIEKAIDLQNPTGVTSAIDGDLAYFAISGGTLVCVNWKTGDYVWEMLDPMGDQEVASSPALSQDLMIIGGGSNRKVIGVSRADGERKWDFQARRMMNGSPIVVGSSTVIGGHDGRVYVLDTESGEKKFEYECGGILSKSPAFADGRLIVTSEQGGVFCFTAVK